MIPRSKGNPHRKDWAILQNHPFYKFSKTWGNIRALQQSVDHVIPRLPFMKLCRQIAEEVDVGNWDSSGYRWQATALECLQEAAETFLTSFFEKANSCAVHGNRQTLMPKDFDLTKFVWNPKVLEQYKSTYGYVVLTLYLNLNLFSFIDMIQSQKRKQGILLNVLAPSQSLLTVDFWMLPSKKKSNSVRR